MGRRERVTAAVAALLAIACAAACGPTSPVAPEDAAEAAAREAAEESERLWTAYRAAPTADAYRAFTDANLAALRRHGEPHDALGVRLQVRLLEAQAVEAARVADPAERGRMAFDVIDAVDSLERRDLFRVWDEVQPGAAATLRAARESARSLVR